MKSKLYSIAVGSDHNGFNLKEEIKKYLIEKGYKVKDFGQYNQAPPSKDYSFAEGVAISVSKKQYDRGILICGSGDGMCIAANKIPGCIASLCYSNFAAEVSRKRNNANIMTLGSKTTSIEQAFTILDIWLNTEFENGVDQKRNIERNLALLKLDEKYRIKQ